MARSLQLEPDIEMPTIYTVGHSNLSINIFLDLLLRKEIKFLVDVRSSPYSKYNSHFNREAIKKTLQDAKIKYYFTGDSLGGRPKDPDCYKEKIIPGDSADYLHLVDYKTVMTKEFFQKGIEKIKKLSEEGRLALMCSEGDPAKCHRHHLIGKYLVNQGVNVIHILSDGNEINDKQLGDLSEDHPVEQLILDF